MNIEDTRKMNLNEEVYVKLTKLGHDEFKLQFDDLKSMAGGDLVYAPIVEDEEGWSKWQLWRLMATFGHMLSTTGDLPFEINIRIKGEKDE
jgi:hypothetical protein